MAIIPRKFITSVSKTQWLRKNHICTRDGIDSTLETGVNLPAPKKVAVFRILMIFLDIHEVEITNRKKPVVKEQCNIPFDDLTIPGSIISIGLATRVTGNLSEKSLSCTDAHRSTRANLLFQRES